MHERVAKNYDVVVVGGGPAGTSAAVHLAMRGARVLLVERERFPRAKLCGEFISPECRADFARLGVAGGGGGGGGARGARVARRARAFAAREVVRVIYFAGVPGAFRAARRGGRDGRSGRRAGGGDALSCAGRAAGRGGRGVTETLCVARRGGRVGVPSAWFGKETGVGAAASAYALGLSRAEMDE